jgi:hypothetical protein
MPPIDLFAGALSLVLIHEETGCAQSALNAARLLDALSDASDIDTDTRRLCERASERLYHQGHHDEGGRHACPA